ncbi:MAG: NAD(P)/FAD-dependent oxidoreductase [Kiritimatiellia bacterium]
MSEPFTIVIAGGGAAGYFAAVVCAESIPDAEVIIIEKSPEPLAKVTISGGGRCNVTHACFDPARLVEHYPRGGRELLGPFHRWQSRDTVRWFEGRGVKIKTEPDGRMFPVTDKSTTVTGCLQREAESAGVRLMTRSGLEAARREGGKFVLTLTNGKTIPCDRLLLATGGNQASPVFRIAEGFGHTIQPLCPSLFSFDCSDERLRDLAGISVPDVEVSLAGTKLRQRGPLLVTHWGLSGPAILKLSAWGAREFAALEYVFTLRVCWTPGRSAEQLRAEIADARREHGRKLIHNHGPWGMPLRLWQSILGAIPGIERETTWNQLPKNALEPLVEAMLASAFSIHGKSMNKDEFVTCGGVSLKEVDFKTMQSRVCPGLYFAGEILDIDGVTGGFNFQAAWTTGWIAGKSMGQEL